MISKPNKIIQPRKSLSGGLTTCLAYVFHAPKSLDGFSR